MVWYFTQYWNVLTAILNVGLLYSKKAKRPPEQERLVLTQGSQCARLKATGHKCNPSCDFMKPARGSKDRASVYSEPHDLKSLLEHHPIHSVLMTVASPCLPDINKINLVMCVWWHYNLLAKFVMQVSSIKSRYNTQYCVLACSFLHLYKCTCSIVHLHGNDQIQREVFYYCI